MWKKGGTKSAPVSIARSDFDVPMDTRLAEMPMFQLGQCAEQNWRRLRGFDYLAKVITGVKFKDGIEVTQVDQVAA